MKNILILLALIIGVGCQASPPETISLDKKFSDEQRAVIIDAVNQWCEAVGWCPEIVHDGEAHIVCETHAQYLKHGRKGVSIAFNQGVDFLSPAGGSIFVDCERSIDFSVAVFQTEIIHEFGHFAIKDHLLTGVMNAGVCIQDHFDDSCPEPVTCVDQLAADTWCANVGCSQQSRSTCVVWK